MRPTRARRQCNCSPYRACCKGMQRRQMNDRPAEQWLRRSLHLRGQFRENFSVHNFKWEAIRPALVWVRRWRKRKRSERGRKQNAEKQKRNYWVALPNATRFKVSFFHGDAVGTVWIRGLRNFQYGKQSCNLSERGCLCELWQICVIASSSVPFGRQSSLLIQGMYSYSGNFSSYLCLILSFKSNFLLYRAVQTIQFVKT